MILAPFRKLIDFIVTSLLWVYFIFGFLLFFGFQVAWLTFRRNTCETGYQQLFNRFFRLFFSLVKLLSPRLTIEIDPKVKSIQSSVIVCNHQSYLDPLLFVSLFEKHKTIVKNTFFKVPIFGWLIGKSGYVPSSANGKHMARVVRHLGEMKDYLEKGGNLFIFPEGTRSRNGKLGEFNKGAFSIAKQCNAPIQVVFVENTNRLFKPGTLLFNTCQRNIIRLESLGTLKPESDEYQLSAEDLAAKAKAMIEKRLTR